MFIDKVQFVGHFNVKSFDKNGNIIDEYNDKNLIMDGGRTNMAQLIGGVTTGTLAAKGKPIDRFVLGTKGHHGTNVLDYIQPGDSEAGQLFASTRTNLISEAVNAKNYRINFTTTGGTDVTTTSAVGYHYTGTILNSTDVTFNTVRRQVVNRAVTYTITVPVENANDVSPVAYTEAALYAGGEIFAMKTFPARVKENTVYFIINWSIIF